MDKGNKNVQVTIRDRALIQVQETIIYKLSEILSQKVNIKPCDIRSLKQLSIKHRNCRLLSFTRFDQFKKETNFMYIRV